MTLTSAGSEEIRAPWGRIALGCIAGVVGGAFLWLIIEIPAVFLLDQLVGRSVWRESINAWPETLRFTVFLARWGAVFAVGQWLSALMSGWSKTAYFAAALQCFHMVTIYWDVDFVALWVLPALIAVLVVKMGWVARAAEMARLRESRRAAVRDGH